MSDVSNLGQHQQEEEDSECLFKLNLINWTTASIKVTILDTEVEAPKILVRNNKLNSGKSDVPALNTFSSSDQQSDIILQDLNEIWGIRLSTAYKTFQNTTQKFMCSTILPLARRYRTDQVLTRKTLLG